MRKILFILLSFVIFSPGPARAGQEIVVLQSFRVKPYEEALKGFSSVCSSRIKRLVISELDDAGIERKISRIRPPLVLAIGLEALLQAKKNNNIPVVYLMVLNPQSILSGEQNITGVGMNIPPEKHLTALLEALPDTESLGLLYDPDRTGLFVKSARRAAAKMGVKLIAREIYNSRDAPSLIADMRDTIDVFWMLPDLTVMTPETVEFLLLFSFDNKIPLFTFSEKYVEMGAFMSMDIDAFDIGRQAGQMAVEILAGEDLKNVPQAYARKAVVSTNVMIARKFGIIPMIAMNYGDKINEKIFRKTRNID